MGTANNAAKVNAKALIFQMMIAHHSVVFVLLDSEYSHYVANLLMRINLVFSLKSV